MRDQGPLGLSLKFQPWWFDLERKVDDEKARPTWGEGLETGKDSRVRSISSWLMVVACDAHVAVSGGLWRFGEERR